MKNNVINLLNGKSNKLNGLFAFCVVLLMVLGCTCNRDFKFGETGSNTPAQKDKPNFPNDSPNKPKTDLPIDKDGFDILDPQKAQALVKNTFADFIEGVEDNDFSTFRSNAAAPFQKEYSAQKIGESFRFFTDNKDKVLPILRQINGREAIVGESKVKIEGGSKIFTINGTFPTSPSTTSFDFKYLNEGGYWRIFNAQIKMQ